jgi:hypothetical protein
MLGANGVSVLESLINSHGLEAAYSRAHSACHSDLDATWPISHEPHRWTNVGYALFDVGGDFGHRFPLILLICF